MPYYLSLLTPKSQTANMSYDAMNRLTNESYEDGTSISYTYTLLGQRKTVTDARGTTTYDYDVQERSTRRVDPDGTEISYSYDLAGNRTSVTIPAGTTSYTFDALNRLDTVVNGTDVTDYDYDGVGNLVNTILPNGVVETRGYDSLNRLLNLETKKGTDTLTGFTYTLSPTGMRTAVTEQDGRKVEYKYDSLYRLTEEKITDAVNGNRTTTYSMDAVGNRLSKSDSVDGTTTYVYDANNRIISDGTSTYVYDARGNTISVTKGTDVTLNTWDDRGRLVKVVITSATGTKVLEYQYDENNIRVSQKVDGVETRFLIDSNTNYAQVLEEYNPINGTVVASYVYGWDLISQDRGGKSFYLYDGLGSTRALTNSSGVVTDRYIYDAYGNLLNSSGATSNNYRFTGEQFDPNLGDYYLRDRYYGTDIGRFTRADSYQGNTSDPLSLNKYLYANGNAVNGIDPSGKFTILELNAAESIRLSITTAYGSIGFNLLGNISDGTFDIDGFATDFILDAVGGVFGIFTKALSVGSSGTKLANPPIGELRFSQTTASSKFSLDGIFQGEKISVISSKIRSKNISPSELPVEYIIRDGTPLIVNTRSFLALLRSGIPESQIKLINKTGIPEVEARITERLAKNSLTDKGAEVIRITGIGKNASNLD
jgi:RHS repeat-associated protein